MRQRNEIIILSLLILLFLFLALYQIELPGLFCDEAFEAIGTLQIMKSGLLKEGPLIQSIYIFDRYFPLVRVSYHGAVVAYCILPFFLLFGVNIVALRLMPISFGILTLMFTYFFAKNFFNRKVAFITILLLVVNPSFIVGTKFGNNNGSIIQMMSMGSLFFFLIWYRTGKNILFYIGMFLLGLGVSTRIWFTWFVIALFVAAFVFRKDIKEAILKSRIKLFPFFAGGLISLCVGAFLIICYNFTYNFSTVRTILENFLQTKHGINNLNYFYNLLFRVQGFVNLIVGRFFLLEPGGKLQTTSRLIQIPANHLYPWLFLFCIIWLIFSVLFRKREYLEKKKIVFLLILFWVIFLQSPFTISCFGSLHLFILYPFLQMILGVTCIDIITLFKKRIKKIITVGLISVFLTCIVIADLNVIINYYSYLRETGGEGNFSNSINELSRWLKEMGILNPLVMDWGLHHSIILLTKGKVIPKCFDYLEQLIEKEPEYTLAKNRFIKNLKQKFQYKDRIYLIFHAPEFTNRVCYKGVLKIVKETGKDITEEKRFYQRDGKLIYLVYSVR